MVGKYNVDGFKFLGPETYEFAKMVAEHKELQEAGAFEYELNEIKAAQMKKVYDALKEKISIYDGAEIRIEKCELFHTDYAIIVKLPYIEFQNDELAVLTKEAGGIAFEAHLDGTMEVSIDFQDVFTEKLK